MQRMKGDSLELAVRVEGEGPTVLLLHGFPDSWKIWRHQIPVLVANGYRVVAPDLRGFGDSDKPAGVEAYRVGKSVSDLVAVLDALEVEDAHVVGHDWGAGVAWAFALMVPQRLRKLVALSVGHPFAPRSIAQREKSWYMLLFQFPEAEELLSRDDFALAREWAASHPDPDWAHVDLTAGLNWYRANLHPRDELGEPPELPPVTADVLGIWSDGDDFLLEPNMTGSEAFVTGSWRYERIDGASHWLQLDAPERVNALLLDFLAE
jgi:pimeloyl-ACP methyl ester carboxylesterase